jgi:hypothetical protein
MSGKTRQSGNKSTEHWFVSQLSVTRGADNDQSSRSSDSSDLLQSFPKEPVMLKYGIAQHYVEALVGKDSHIVGVNPENRKILETGFAGFVDSNLLPCRSQGREIQQR